MSNSQQQNQPIEINCRRLLCPMPVIRVQDAVKAMEHDQTLVAYCTDPGVKHDIPAWCRVHGHDVVDLIEVSGEIHITVKANHSKSC